MKLNCERKLCLKYILNVRLIFELLREREKLMTSNFGRN